MDSIRAAALRQQRGDKSCDHPQLEPEFAQGLKTGDYVCTTCGATDIGPGWNKKRTRKSTAKVQTTPAEDVADLLRTKVKPDDSDQT